MGANIFLSAARGPRTARLARGAYIGIYHAPDLAFSIPPLALRITYTVYLYRKGRPGYPPEPPARATTVRYRPGVLYFLPYSDRCQSVNEG